MCLACPDDVVSFPIPIPGCLILFSPHPDDISISMGALAARAAEMRIPTSIVLMTDGSEARLPAKFLRHHGWTPDLPPAAQRDLRGRIRVAEAREEACRLGFSRSDVLLLTRQRWFSQHRTHPNFLHDDLSLRDVARFEPGEVDQEAENEIRLALGSGEDTVCAAPDPNDRLYMHRISTALVTRALGNARLLTYECLSTVAVTGNQVAFPFSEELLARKRHAILAHESMRAPREAFGGYSNPGNQSYDEIVTRRNAELARQLGLHGPYAERYGWR